MAIIEACGSNSLADWVVATNALKRMWSGLLGALATSVAAGILIAVSSTSARASCGDYVQLGKQAVAPHSSIPQVAPEAQADRSTGLPRVPCHGPHCSSAPRPTPLAPATVTTIPMDWGVLPAQFAPQGNPNHAALPRESISGGLAPVRPPTPPPRLKS